MRPNNRLDITLRKGVNRQTHTNAYYEQKVQEAQVIFVMIFPENWICYITGAGDVG